MAFPKLRTGSLNCSKRSQRQSPTPTGGVSESNRNQQVAVHNMRAHGRVQRFNRPLCALSARGGALFRLQTRPNIVFPDFIYSLFVLIKLSGL